MRRERIVMLLENNPYPDDVRVRSEARTLVGAGHRVAVLAPLGPGQPARELLDGVEVVRFAAAPGDGGGMRGYAREYLRAATVLSLWATRRLPDATVLHIHNPPDILFGVAALYRAAGRRVVFDHHDLFPETVQAKFGDGPAARAARGCQRLTIAAAHHVIATNASYAEIALRSKRPGEVTVVRNAPPRAWTELPLVWRDGVLHAPRLAYLGAVSSQDGVGGLAPVLRALRERERLLPTVTIIGDGDGCTDVRRALAAHGVADCVTFTGWVSHGRVARLLQDADICVDPAPATDVNERSTMTKIAEYMALGKPVVAYDLLESSRTLGTAGVVVPRGEPRAFAAAIARMCRDPDLRRRTGLQARTRVRSALTWEHSERALLGAYAALRGPGASSPLAAPPPDARPATTTRRGG